MTLNLRMKDFEAAVNVLLDNIYKNVI